VLPSVAPFVSLAQTRTFTYTPLSHDLNLTHMDKLTPAPLLLDELVIDLRHLLHDRDSTSAVTKCISVGLDGLLSSTNPTRCHFFGRPTSIWRIPFWIQFPQGLDWSRTRTVTLTHATCSDVPGYAPAFSVDTPLFDLVLDLTEYCGDHAHDLDFELKQVVGKDITSSWRAESQDAGRTLGDVQIWLHDKREVEVAKRILIDDVDDKWKKNYACLKIGVKR
jgi:hypothetical protein